MKQAILILGILAACLAWALRMGVEQSKVIGEFSTSVEGRNPNQRHNAALCLLKLRGKVIAPGHTFSFNHVVGTWSRDQGYRKAPVSYNGTLIDAWGGGVCQTSTTLYNAALLAGMEIVERHPHHYAPNYVQPGRDAAVAYSHVDLCFKNPYRYPVTISGTVTSSRITLRLRSAAKTPVVCIRQDVLNRIKPREYTVGTGGYGRVINPGKPGWEVATYRYFGETRMLVSRDQYPVMNRVTRWQTRPLGR